MNVTSIAITDDLGNITTISAADLQTMGIDTSIAIISPDPDTTAPVLVSLALPEVIDLSAGDTILSYGASASSSTQIRVSQDTPSGTVDIDHVELTDVYGNTRTYTADELRELGFATSLEIVGSAAPPAQQTCVAMLPDTITIREGQSVDLSLDFIGMTNTAVHYDYAIMFGGATADASDISQSTGSGVLSVASTVPVDRIVDVSISTLRDSLVETTETAWLVVQLSGGMTFSDGSQIQVVEIRIADESWAIGGSGNDAIVGTALGELLVGKAGDDTLTGLRGDDTLLGGTGNDQLRGDGGDDVINGGAGDDTAVFSGSVNATVNLGISGIQVTGYGNDQLLAIENVTSGAGNDMLIGNRLANVLNGGGGDDSLLGGAGDDTLLGGTGNDQLRGADGDDVIDGGAGSDTLIGGAGADTFAFGAALGASNVDRIGDFTVLDDTIWLGNAIFTSLSAGELSASAFTINTSGLATDALDRIIYELDTGNLYYDADGTGAGARVLFATLPANLAMTAADFLVI